MSNYIVSYELNGSTPTHKQMDQHMADAGWTRARILETVWYVGTPQTRREVYDHVNAILSKNDQIIVISASAATFRNLLVDDDSLQAAWGANA
jgi:hypothetical protein